MNKSLDELESELRSLRPTAPSERVRRGITGQLASGRRPTARTNAWVWGALALAIAAGLTAAIVYWPAAKEVRPPGPGDDMVQARPEMDPWTEVHPPPTLLAYHQVLGESEASLDDLLNRHAASLLVGGDAGSEFGSLVREVDQN
jgi:hypothetical protein